MRKKGTCEKPFFRGVWGENSIIVEYDEIR
jgi:hypothetical protein